MDTHQVVARFEQERQALALMDHPHIARVLDAGATESGRPFFVMELVKGEPIVDYCDRHNLSIHERLALLAQVCSAVQHAHTKGIIHRDLKPSNVLVTLQDGKPTPKIIDFGIAKATNARLTEHTLFTEHRQLIGTPEYMSPEQAEGSMDIDTRTDVYSLGVLLYELLTGSTPFTGGELRSAAFAELQRIIREVEPPAPSTRISRNSDTLASVAAKRHTEPAKLTSLLRGELDWIVMKALEKDRQRRYETASALAADISRFLSGEVVLAAPPGAAYRIQKFVRRHRAAVLSTAAVALSLIAGVAAFAWQAAAARDQRDRALAAEAATAIKADELGQVSAFQARMLRDIDVSATGEALLADLRSRFDSALDKAAVAPADRAPQTETFRNQLNRINATDAAGAMIEDTILKPALKAIDSDFATQPAVAATLRSTLANLYEVLGNYPEAISLHRNVLATRRSLLGPDDPLSIDALFDLAGALESKGDIAEAEQLQRETLEKMRAVFGPDDPKTLSAKSALGSLLRALARYDEAEPLLKDALDGLRRTSGPEARDTLVAINTYGYLLVVTGRLKEAESLWRESYETGRRVLGPDHPDVFIWMNNLGALLADQGRLAESEELQRDAYENFRRTRGEDHPQTIQCLGGLAGSLRTQGRYAEAEEIFRRILEVRRRDRGEDHSLTIESLGQLGMTLMSQQKFDEAEPLLRAQLAKRKLTLGPDHPDTLIAQSNLSILLKNAGKLNEAHALTFDTLERRRRVLGEDHFLTLTSASNFAVDLLDLQQYAQAEAIARDVLERRRRILGEDHRDTMISLNILAQALRRQQKLADAEPFARAAAEGGRRAMGPDHPDALIASVNLAGLLIELERFTEAKPLLDDALPRCTRVTGPTSMVTLNATTMQAAVLRANNQPQAAIDLLEPAEDGARARMTGPAATRLAALLLELGAARASLAEIDPQFAMAEQTLLEAHELFLKLRGESHRETRRAAAALADLYDARHRLDPTRGDDAKSQTWRAKANPAK
jgi:non-specific serine/threonine protein kinase/serine/threonine-protein kinase